MGEGVGRSALLLGALPARPQARGDGVIYWFRTDLRVGDNLALAAASASAARLLPVYCHDPAAETPTRWGFTRRGAHRRTFLDAALTDLDAALRARGSRLLQVRGAAADVLPALARALGTDRVACEAIAAPRRHEAEQGASDGSYWLWFELLWRDYFRFLHLQHGRRLYRARGLGAHRHAGRSA